MAARPKASSKQRQGRRKYGARRHIPWIPIAVVLVAVVGAFFLVRSLEVGAPGERIAVSGVGQHPPEGQPIAYKEVPPAGGPHWPSAAPWGFSPTVPDERAVHNLEHGGIVVSHSLIPQADLDRIRLLLTTYPRDRYGEVKLLIRPYERIPAGTFVLAAWGWRQSFTAYDDTAVRAFMDAHLNRCCESVP
ncbi:MAG: DUF3105 domain-containing protein [Chloroflexi bacterium]|nr:DUF3105 domain-containing protein [Chloroflexota bacterium]